MTELHALHALDQAVALEPKAENLFSGRTTDDYQNMVGPFGGITAAVLVNAVMQHPQLIGEPVSLTVNFAGPVATGDFEIEARPVRTNRSTQHWMLILRQGDQVATTATLFTAIRGESWADQELERPDAPSPEDVVPVPKGLGLKWMKNYDFRFVSGLFNPGQAGLAPDSHSLLWIRDEPARPLDFPALAALGDSFFPRVFVRHQQVFSAGTVTLTLHFHTDSKQLAEVGDGYLLGRAQANQARRNYVDQAAHLWSDKGDLLLSSNQMMYFKL